MSLNDNQATRVILSDIARQKSPRVAEMENRKANDFINSGTQVRKKVGKTISSGTVMKYNKDTKEYTIEYSDGNYNRMRHREIVDHKCTIDTNAVKILKRCKEKQQANATLKQSTAAHPTKKYAHAVWEDEEGRML